MDKSKKEILQLKGVISEFSEDELVMIMNKISLEFVCSEFINGNCKDKELLESIIFVTQHIFNNTGIDIECFVPNDTYDILYEMYRDICNKEMVGSSIIPSDKEKRSHNYPDLRGTISKVHYVHESDRKTKDTRKSLEKWIKSVINSLPENLRNRANVGIYGKWDGISGIFELVESHNIDAVLTRGDTENNVAVDIGKFFKNREIKSLIPYFQGERVGVKTEMVMTKEDFEYLNDNYGFKSPRAMVSSLFNTDEPNQELLSYLTIVPLRVQNYRTKEIKVIDSEKMNLKHKTLVRYANIYLDDLDEISKKMLEVYHSTCEEYPCDGIVIVLEDKEICNILGRDGAINKFEVAFKFPAERKTTILKSVTFSIGLLGGITPVANFEPVVLKGNTVSNASLGSVDRFESLGLAVGDEIDVLYEIIPYVELKKSSGNKLIETPKMCPSCGNPLQKTPLLSCVNINCPSVKAGKILNYISKMKISFISIGLLGKLIQNGIISDISDLYNLKKRKSEIVNIEGIGDKIIDKVITSIDSRKNIPMHVFLGSLGIDCAGRKTFEKICKVYHISTIDDIKKYLLNSEYLIKVPTIKIVTANKIVSGISTNLELINKLLRVLDIKEEKSDERLKVCFTKVRDKDFERYLETINVCVDNTYGPNTQLLIIPNKETESSKITKAKKSNKKIMTIDEAYINFNYNKIN